MAIGNTNSGGSTKSSSNINITRTYEVEFTEGSFPLTFTNQLNGKYDRILIQAGSAANPNFSTNVSWDSGSLYESSLNGFVQQYMEDNTGYVEFMSYPVGNSSTPRTSPVPCKFTDSNGNIKYGYRSLIVYTNTTSATATPSYTNLQVALYRGYMNTEALNSKQVKVKFNYSLLLWNTETNAYEVYDASYQSSGTSSVSFTTYPAYFRFKLNVSIPTKYILVGITDIDCRYNVVGINDETDGF